MRIRATQPVKFRHYDGTAGRIGNAIHVANPGEKAYARRRYLFQFGAIGTRFVLVYGDDPCDALEDAAEFLLDAGWLGFITPHDHGRDSLGCDCADPFECDAHTYTESGWLTSWEWTFIEDPANEELRAIHHNS